MDLLDRYAHAVRTYLPKSLSEAQRDDIIAELSENIRAQMDDREAELGRSLTEAEQSELLRQYSHPMIAAGRYQTNQEARVVFGRQLIGPVLFPFYERTLWIVMAISLAIYAAVVVVLAVTGNPITAGDAMNTAIVQIAIQFVVITAIFTAMEQYLPTMQWSAERLPVPRPQAPTVPRVSRLESFAEIVAIIVLVAWAGFALNKPSLFVGPAGDAYQLAPVWQRIVIPTLLVLAVSVARAVINIIRPEWVRLKRVVSVLTDIAGLGILIYLLQADSWVVLANGDAAPGRINEFVHYGLLSTSVGFLIVIAVDGWKLIRGERQQRRQDQPQQAQPA